MKNKVSFIIIIVTLALSGCNNDEFYPFTGLENKITAYCILDNRMKTQYVRVHQLYQENTPKKLSSNTKVILSEMNGKNYILRDSVVPGFSEYNMFYSPDFILNRGSSYRLTVISDSLSQYADTFVPQNSGIRVDFRLDSFPVSSTMPWPYYKFVTSIFAPNAHKINHFRLYVEYEIIENGMPVKKSALVPYKIHYENNKPEQFIIFESFLTLPIIWWLPDDAFAFYPVNEKFNMPASFEYECWFYVFKEIAKNVESKNITIKRGIAIYYSMDEFYNNNFMRREQQTYSIRLDDGIGVTNFYDENYKEGIGYFSSVTVDTAEFRIIPYFIKKFGFNDGQSQTLD